MTLDSLTSLAESTSSTFLYLQLSLLSLSASSSLSHAASHLGVAQGITTLLRALPYHASQGRIVIPAEITARHGVSQEEVFRRGGQAKGIDDAVFEFATAANDNLQTCTQILKSEERVPGRAKTVFLNAVCRTSLFLCPCIPNGPVRCRPDCIWSAWKRQISTRSIRLCKSEDGSCRGGYGVATTEGGCRSMGIWRYCYAAKTCMDLPVLGVMNCADGRADRAERKRGSDGGGGKETRKRTEGERRPPHFRMR